MLHNQGPDLLFSELSKDELAIAKEHLEITRHLQEIHQLYLMFQYALDSFDAKYLLMSDGKVLKNGEPAISEDDFIDRFTQKA